MQLLPSYTYVVLKGRSVGVLYFYDMYMKQITLVVVLFVVGGLVFLFMRQTPEPIAPIVVDVPQHVVSDPNPNGRVGAPDTPAVPAGKLKADVFSGTLEAVDTGCFADGECFITVDGKHVTALMGWSRDTVGSVQGVEGFGDLEKYIGKDVEVYAQDLGEGRYTLYGSEGFYIKLK